jgi:hypothetical protein
MGGSAGCIAAQAPRRRASRRDLAGRMRSIRMGRTSQSILPLMPSLVLSTIVFFIVSFFTRRHLDDLGCPELPPVPSSSS